jgi:hypothetical protein
VAGIDFNPKRNNTESIARYGSHPERDAAAKLSGENACNLRF